MLNFDPHRWIAERGEERPSVAVVATVAEVRAKTEKWSEEGASGGKPCNSAVSSLGAEKSISTVTAATPATVATPITDGQARAMLRDWHARLSRLDDSTAPAGLTYGQWVQRVDDACWLYENFAGRAVRDGWSALDLFGVTPGTPGGGGLVDRLRGARDLKMDADRAAWSVGGRRERFCRGAGDGLRASGPVLIWEVGR